MLAILFSQRGHFGWEEVKMRNSVRWYLWEEVKMRYFIPFLPLPPSALPSPSWLTPSYFLLNACFHFCCCRCPLPTACDWVMGSPRILTSLAVVLARGALPCPTFNNPYFLKTKVLEVQTSPIFFGLSAKFKLITWNPFSLLCAETTQPIFVINAIYAFFLPFFWAEK